MACCGAAERPSHSFLWLLVLLLGTGAVGAAACLVALVEDALFAFRRGNLGRTRAFFSRALGNIARRMLEEPFLLPSTARCRVSGRLYRTSPRLAGNVFKYFNAILFLGMGLLAAGATALVTALLR